MRILDITASTLALLALQELNYTSQDTPNLKLFSKKVQASDFFNEDGTTTQNQQTTTTKPQSQAIAPPESIDTPTFASVATVEQNTPTKEKASHTTIDSKVKASDTSTDIFAPYLEQIRTSLPPGLVMRLPSPVLLSDRFNSQDEKYFVQVSPSTSEASLTVSVFSCQEQLPSCLVGSFAVAANTSEQANQTFKQHQSAGTLTTITNNIQGYLLESENQEASSTFSSLMWGQDNQFYTIMFPVQERQSLIDLGSSMAQGVPIASSTTLGEISSEQPKTETAPEVQEETQEFLGNRQPILTTAEHLRQGEILTSLGYRQSFPSGTPRQIGLTGQPTFGITWGITDDLEITVDLQTVDNGGPGRQGLFRGTRINPDGSGPNFFQEFTFQAKQQLWQNQTGNLALSGVVGISEGNGGRPFRFTERRNIVASGQNTQVVLSLELPFTITDDRWQFTFSPKVAFLPEDNALYFNTLPINQPGSFGTTFGLAGGISYRLSPRLLLWGDAFVPFTGNNTINRSTGLPEKTVAFNAGLRYWVNPRLATDLFVSNTLGNTGALSIVADQEFPALGLGVTFLPGVTSANRRYLQHFGSTQQPHPSTPAGFAWLDGGTVANQQLQFTLQGGEQGLFTGIKYGLLDDLEIGTFLSLVPGTVDESELGVSGKIRFLHQADGDPFTLSGAVSLARSNNVLLNLVRNNRNELARRGIEKGGFALSNEQAGELLIITLSTPIHYQFEGGSALWLTPTVGFVQRNGLEVAGFNLGGSVPLITDLDAIAEIGLDLSGKGNAFIGNNRETVIPWSLGLRWYPASLLGISQTSALSDLQLEVYATNRVGSSPFGSLRVRADNDTAIGFGLVLPIR
ncbi:MAG: hypothetical protein F6K14_25220 [Symploca sp. SIO2C1]|nr:hypothetical protein [Symploca sp. SIO2C1]